MPRDERTIQYDVHATRRMQQRRMNQAEVEQVVRSTAREADGDDWLGFPKFRAFLRMGGRYIQVAFSDRGDHLYVITVMIRAWCTMRMTYSRTADCLMIHLDHTKERVNGAELPGGVGFIDLAADGTVLAVEIMDASRYYPKAALDSLGEEETVMSLADAAAIAGLTPIAMRKAVERGRLSAKKIGRDWVVTAHDLTDYLNSRRIKATAAI